MPKRCVVPHCQSDQGEIDHTNDGPMSFHSFPSDPFLRAEWTSACGREPVWEPKRYSRLCSKHFTGDCFRVESRDSISSRKRKRHDGLLKKKTLNDDAVPTIFELYMHSCSAGECYRTPVNCPQCKKFTAFSEKDLRLHLSAVHVGYLPFGCEHCLSNNIPTWLATVESLQMHNTTEHPGLDVQARNKIEKRKERQLAKMMAEFPNNNRTPKTKVTPKMQIKMKNPKKVPKKEEERQPEMTGEVTVTETLKKPQTRRKYKEVLTLRSSTVKRRAVKEEGNDEEPSISIIFNVNDDQVAQSNKTGQTESPSDQPISSPPVEKCRKERILVSKGPKLNFVLKQADHGRFSQTSNTLSSVPPCAQPDVAGSTNLEDTAASDIPTPRSESPDQVPQPEAIEQNQTGAEEPCQAKTPELKRKRKAQRRSNSTPRSPHLVQAQQQRATEKRRRLAELKLKLNPRRGEPALKTELLFTCGPCQTEVFRTKDHVISTHLTAKMYSCGYCSYSVGSHRHIRQHATDAHSGQPRKFITNDSLTDEVVTKHQECFGFDYRNAMMSCSFCGSTVPLVRVEAHGRSAHENEAVKCATCGRIFPSVDAYVNHHDQAHPEVSKRYRKPVPIELQNACFPAGSRPVEEGQKTPMTKRSTPSHQKVLLSMKCRECGEMVAAHNARPHARNHFATDGPFFCPICTFSDQARAVVSAHLKQVHPRENIKLPPALDKNSIFENKGLVLKCFGFNMVECDYCHEAVPFWKLRAHACAHFEELGEQSDFRQFVKRCYGAVLHI